MKWTAQDWVLAASLAGNAVLGVALFFKTALNEFFTTMIKARSARKERRRQLMIELNGRLHSFDANYFFVASSNVLKETAPTEAGREAAKGTFEAVSAKHIDTLEFLAAHDLEFPAEIRKGVRDLRAEMVMDVDKLNDLATILERSQAVTEAVNKVRADLERIVK